MKTTKISVHINTNNRKLVTSALLATFSPFGSLTDGVDGNALAEAMTRWVDAKTEGQKEMANELIGLVWSATTDRFSTVEVGSWEVSLRTPTSGTRIRLQRYTGGSYHVEVDFGTNGSESRSINMLSVAERNGVKFEVYDGEGRVSRAYVISCLYKNAKKHLKWLESLGPDYYSEEYKVEAFNQARKSVAYFEECE